MTGFLLDTNVLAEGLRPRPDPLVARWLAETDDRQFHVSVISLGEIRKGITLLPAGAKRTRLDAWMNTDLKFRLSDRILPVTSAIAEIWGALVAKAQLAGRPIPAIDALLAATAVHHGLVVVTRNVADLRPAGAQWLNPWESVR